MDDREIYGSTGGKSHIYVIEDPAGLPEGVRRSKRRVVRSNKKPVTPQSIDDSVGFNAVQTRKPSVLARIRGYFFGK